MLTEPEVVLSLVALTFALYTTRGGMTTATMVLTVGLLTLTVLVLTFNNRALRKNIDREKEDRIANIKQRDLKLEDCKTKVIQSEKAQTNFENLVRKTEEEKVKLQAELDKQKGESAKQQKSAAELEVGACLLFLSS
nr:uncharacterized protein LOC128697349 isoform X2 [Cherax quadricarinatus]